MLFRSINNTANQRVPIEITTINNVNNIEAGYEQTIATTTDGTLYTWGYNSYGRLGLGDTTRRLIPTPNQSISNPINIGAGYEQLSIIGNDSFIYTTGRGDEYQMGNGTNRSTNQNPTVFDTSAIPKIIVK